MADDLVDPIATYRTGCAAKWMVCLSGAMDAFDPDEPYTQIYLFDIEELGWNFNEHDDIVSSICLWSNPKDPDDRYFVALCENGDVIIEDESLTHERIADAGIGRPDSKGFGYLVAVAGGAPVERDAAIPQPSRIAGLVWMTPAAGNSGVPAGERVGRLRVIEPGDGPP